jgi:hypothetical protein
MDEPPAVANAAALMGTASELADTSGLDLDTNEGRNAGTMAGNKTLN